MRFLLPLALLACVPTPGDDGTETGLDSDAAELGPVSLFVIGDSWAELSQGTVAAFSTDSMPVTALEDRGVEVVADYTYGFGGTAAVFWYGGVPCDTPQSNCSDNGVDEDFFADLAAAEGTPVIYLSLGGNDVRVGGGLVDLTAQANRDEVFGNVRIALTALVDEMLTARPDAEIVIAGYANFHFDGRPQGQEITCEEGFDAMLAATPSPSLELVNSMFATGSYDGTPVAGLHGLYDELAAANPEVSFTPHHLMFAEAPTEEWSPSPAGTMVDCLHLQPELQRAFVEAVVGDWLDARE